MSNVLINVDLSQAELRVMAILSNDAWMIAALQEEEGDFFDYHLMPVAFPWIADKFGTVDAYKEAEPIAHKEDRTKVKAVQYGLAFGRQAKAIGDSLGIGTRDAQAIIDNYLYTATGFAQWREDIKAAATNPTKRDLLINPFGRKFQSEIITGKNRNNIEREALSFLPQSTSSDLCMTTAVRVHKDLNNAGYHIFNMVHDAIMIEGPEENADVIGQWVGEQLKATGLAVMGDAVPFKSDYSIGKSWSDLS